MQEFDKIKKYCDDVSDQIRWKKAKPVIVKEIENHICDQRDTFITDGDNEELATDKAIKQMGDAVFVGQELDRTHRPKPQIFMISLTGMLICIGMYFNYILCTSSESLNRFEIFPYFIAIGVFLFCYYIDFTILGKYAKKLYYTALLLSVIILLFFSDSSSNVMFFTFPSFRVSFFYTSLIYPLVFALFIYAKRNMGIKGILMCGLAYLPFTVILIITNTLSGMILYTIVSLAVLFFAVYHGWFGFDKKQRLFIILSISLVAVCILTIFFVFFRESIQTRLNILLNPEQDRFGKGFQYCIIRDILSEAVFFGKGNITEFVQNISKFPYSNSDYLLTYMIHKVGFVILIPVLSFIILFSIVGMYKTFKEKSILGSLIAFTIMFTFILHSIVYIIDNFGYRFISSVSLPFISYGKTSLIIFSGLVGFMLSVFRTGDIFKENGKQNKNKENSVFSFEDGKRIINFKPKRI